ncbi:hypothetical protein DEO72_LG11g3666 [Vigna unguiculata]|uniref:Uncharacterized protein n=1 Tax=Vigna unguiculata TaxID=3917 RepID=A0A4D6NT91_VIGUN|nr:hypothetical protein DEO72_LG11g3666 [Vigna unguiculata]
MASSSSRPKRIKRTAVKITSRPANLDGWISDDEQHDIFVKNWKDRNIINPKYIDIDFFRTNGFRFQEHFAYQSLEKFVQLQGIYYPNLLRVFYANARENNGTVVSRVKGVNIILDNTVWTTVAGFQIGGEKSHVGSANLRKMEIYKSLLRHPSSAKRCNFYKTGGMKRDDRVMAFIIGWILAPRAGNHGQLLTEDIFLMHAINSRVKINWSALVSDTIIKTTNLQMYPLPYALFLSRVFEYYNLDLADEVSVPITHSSLIELNALHHMGFVFNDTEWTFKDDPSPSAATSPPPLSTDHSTHSDVLHSLAALTLSVARLDEKVTKLLKYHHINDEEDDPVTQDAVNTSDDASAAAEDNPNSTATAANIVNDATDEETYSTADDMSD